MNGSFRVGSLSCCTSGFGRYAKLYIAATMYRTQLCIAYAGQSRLERVPKAFEGDGVAHFYT